MSDEINRLVTLVTTMRTEQSQANEKVDTHLTHLRGTVHKLANDMVGVSQLTTILHTEVAELKKKQGEDIVAVHGHIDRETKELSDKVGAMEKTIFIIAPKAESFGKIVDNFGRAVMVVLVGLLFTAVAFFMGNKTP